MSEYVAPLRDMQFVLRELAGLDAVGGLPGYEEVNEELASAILEEAGKFASGVLSPLNVVGDREGARWNDSAVQTAAGWREAYRQFAEGGVERAVLPHGVRWPRASARGVGTCRGDVERRERGVRPLPHAHARRDRGSGAVRH